MFGRSVALSAWSLVQVGTESMPGMSGISGDEPVASTEIAVDQQPPPRRRCRARRHGPCREPASLRRAQGRARARRRLDVPQRGPAARPRRHTPTRRRPGPTAWKPRQVDARRSGPHLGGAQHRLAGHAGHEWALAAHAVALHDRHTPVRPPSRATRRPIQRQAPPRRNAPYQASPPGPRRSGGRTALFWINAILVPILSPSVVAESRREIRRHLGTGDTGPCRRVQGRLDRRVHGIRVETHSAPARDRRPAGRSPAPATSARAPTWPRPQAHQGAHRHGTAWRAHRSRGRNPCHSR